MNLVWGHRRGYRDRSKWRRRALESRQGQGWVEERKWCISNRNRADDGRGRGATWYGRRKFQCGGWASALNNLEFAIGTRVLKICNTKGCFLGCSKMGQKNMNRQAVGALFSHPSTLKTVLLGGHPIIGLLLEMPLRPRKTEQSLSKSLGKAFLPSIFVGETVDLPSLRLLLWGSVTGKGIIMPLLQLTVR